MSIFIDCPTFDDLSEEEKESVPDNGWGKDAASYYRITLNGVVVALKSDAMEPEDAMFYRDLSWIPGMLKQAHDAGLEADNKRLRDVVREYIRELGKFPRDPQRSTLCFNAMYDEVMEAEDEKETSL